MVFISLVVAKMFAKILKIPYYVLGTFIMLLAITGCYAYQGNMTDVYLMIFGGIFGYFFKKYHFSTSALILGLVLGPMCEKNFRNAVTLAKGSYSAAFLQKPITVVLLAVCITLFVYPILKPIFSKKKVVK